MTKTERIAELERRNELLTDTIAQHEVMLWDLLELVELAALAIAGLREDRDASNVRITENRTTIGPDQPNK